MVFFGYDLNLPPPPRGDRKAGHNFLVPAFSLFFSLALCGVSTLSDHLSSEFLVFVVSPYRHGQDQEEEDEQPALGRAPSAA